MHPIALGANISFIEGTHDGEGWPFTVKVENSSLTATVELEEFNVRVYSKAIAFIYDAVSAPINLLGFKYGVHFQVTIDEMIGPLGRGPICLEQQNLAALNTSINDETFGQMIFVLAKDNPLRMILSDLVELLGTPKAANVNCGRIMDGVKHLITRGDEAEVVKWKNMHVALNVTRNYLEPISKHSTKPRHGQLADTSDEMVTVILERCWSVIDRYFHYLLRGEVSLPIEQFPLLNGEQK